VDRAKPFDIPKREVWEAYKRVRANHGAAGVDGQSIAEFEADLTNNLYKLWNRLSSGSYFPPPVRRVDIPKDDGRTRPLGIPTVADRIAQMVVKRFLEPLVEPYFHEDSYGYRPGKSALDAVGVARQRCWRYAWVLDLDIKSFFETIDRGLLMRAVRKHTDCPWVLLYLERWLQAPVQMADGSLVGRERGTPQSLPRRRPGAGWSAPSWRISFFITRSTSGCGGTIRRSRSSAMPMMRFVTAAAKTRQKPCGCRLRSVSPNAD
jgi:RNA-directed DNA polymerase